MTVTITKTVGTREDLMTIFSLEERFIKAWLKAGCGNIPQMPHLPDLGSGTRFHLATVEAWLLEHFQRGGSAGELPPSRRKTQPQNA